MILSELRTAFPSAVAIVDTTRHKLFSDDADQARLDEKAWRGVIAVLEPRRERINVDLDGRKVSAWVYGLDAISDILTSRLPRDGYFIRVLAGGKSIWETASAPDIVAMAKEAMERGASSPSRTAALQEWSRIDRVIADASRCETTSDAHVVLMKALDVCAESAFVLGARWVPAPGGRLGALATIDPRLALAARDCANPLAPPRIRLESLKSVEAAIRDLYPPPLAFFRSREPGTYSRGPLQALVAPFTLIRDFFAEFARWAPRSVGHLWPIVRLARLMRPHWRIAATIAALSLGTALLSLPIPLLMGAIMRSSSTTAFVLAGGVVLGLVIIQGIVSAIAATYAASAKESLWVQWQAKFVRRLLGAPAEVTTRFAPGELAYRFDDARASFELLLDILITALHGTAYLCLAPVILVMLPLAFSLHILVVAILLAAIYAVYSAVIQKYIAGVTNLHGQLSARMIEVLSHITSIRASRLEKAASQRVTSKAGRLRDETVKLQAIISVIGIALGAVSTMAPLLLFMEGYFLVQTGVLDAGTAMGVGFWVAMVLGPVTSLFGLGPVVQRLAVHARRFLEVYDGAARAGSGSEQKPRIADRRAWDRPFPSHAKELRLEELRYSPSPLRPSLWNLNTKIELPGLTAIVGPSGVGKSTLLFLMDRALAPTSGRIRIDKEEIGEITPDEWRRNCAIVPQDDYILEGSVHENLAVGLSDSLDAFVAEAVLRRVGLWEILSEREGLDTRLDPSGGGGGLSTGERKRLCLARALLRRPRILLVDEMVDLVDPELEDKLLGVLREASAVDGVRVIFVAHRPSARDFADRVITLTRSDEGTANGEAS